MYNETMESLPRNGFFHCPPQSMSRPSHAMEFHTPGESGIFGYVTEGSGHIETAEDHYSVSAGSFFFIAEETGAYLYPDAETPWKKLSIHAEGSLTGDLVRTFRLAQVTVERRDVRRQFIELYDTLSEMEKKQTSDGMGRVACLLFEVLTEIRKDLFATEQGETKASAAESVKAFIDNNLYNDISLETVADVFGWSKMHIIRLFKKAFGTTPMQYQMERRVSVAKSLLSGTVMPIREISDLLRFSTTQHFSNTFKKSEGISPSKYRQSKQKRK